MGPRARRYTLSTQRHNQFYHLRLIMEKHMQLTQFRDGGLISSRASKQVLPCTRNTPHWRIVQIVQMQENIFIMSQTGTSIKGKADRKTASILSLKLKQAFKVIKKRIRKSTWYNLF